MMQVLPAAQREGYIEARDDARSLRLGIQCAPLAETTNVCDSSRRSPSAYWLSPHASPFTLAK